MVLNSTKVVWIFFPPSKQFLTHIIVMGKTQIMFFIPNASQTAINYFVVGTTQGGNKTFHGNEKQQQ